MSRLPAATQRQSGPSFPTPWSTLSRSRSTRALVERERERQRLGWGRQREPEERRGHETRGLADEEERHEADA